MFLFKNKFFLVGLFLVQLLFSSDLDSGIDVNSGINPSSNELKKNVNMTYIKSKIRAKIYGGGNHNDIILEGSNVGGVNMVNSKAKNIYLNTEIKGDTITTGEKK